MPAALTQVANEGCFDASNRNAVNAALLGITGGTVGSATPFMGVNTGALVSLLVNGAVPITTPLTPTMFQINKAGVLADTLAAPVAGTDDGKIIWIVSNTANAHTVTATGLFQVGAAPVNLATFAAFAGAGFQAMALNAKWVVLSQMGITFT